jgi:hypothetical protein
VKTLDYVLLKDKKVLNFAEKFCPSFSSQPLMPAGGRKDRRCLSQDVTHLVDHPYFRPPLLRRH